MRNFTTVHDVENVQKLLEKALKLKKKYSANPSILKQVGENKTLGLIFFNPSLRTRMSSERAAINLGMSVIGLDADRGWQIEFEEGAVMDGNKAEHIKEAARVMSQYCDILAVRSFATLDNREQDYQDFVIQKFVQYATVPVVSLEGAILHPLQSLADLITIEEYKKVKRPKVVLTWAPHPKALPQAVPNSFVEWMQKGNVDLVVTHPEGYELAPRFSEGTHIEYNQNKAFEGADFIYAKNWSNYNNYGQILSIDKSWTVTSEKMALTNDAKFMHCLPVRRNMVVADAVIDSANSIVFEQANNRTYSAMAVLYSILEKMQEIPILI